MGVGNDGSIAATTQTENGFCGVRLLTTQMENDSRGVRLLTTQMGNGSCGVRLLTTQTDAPLGLCRMGFAELSGEKATTTLTRWMNCLCRGEEMRSRVKPGMTEGVKFGMTENRI